MEIGREESGKAVTAWLVQGKPGCVYFTYEIGEDIV